MTNNTITDVIYFFFTCLVKIHFVSQLIFLCFYSLQFLQKYLYLSNFLLHKFHLTDIKNILHQEITQLCLQIS